MDEKSMVATNALNRLRQIDLGAKLQAQIEKRADAPPPTEAKVAAHLAVAVAPATTVEEIKAASGNAKFFDLWDEYYPKLVGWLGWATALPKWMLPMGIGPALLVFKSMLAVIDNLMKILRPIMT